MKIADFIRNIVEKIKSIFSKKNKQLALDSSSVVDFSKQDVLKDSYAEPSVEHKQFVAELKDTSKEYVYDRDLWIGQRIKDKVKDLAIESIGDLRWSKLADNHKNETGAIIEELLSSKDNEIACMTGRLSGNYFDKIKMEMSNVLGKKDKVTQGEMEDAFGKAMTSNGLELMSKVGVGIKKATNDGNLIVGENGVYLKTVSVNNQNMINGGTTTSRTEKIIRDVNGEAVTNISDITITSITSAGEHNAFLSLSQTEHVTDKCGEFLSDTNLKTYNHVTFPEFKNSYYVLQEYDAGMYAMDKASSKQYEEKTTKREGARIIYTEKTNPVAGEGMCIASVRPVNGKIGSEIRRTGLNEQDVDRVVAELKSQIDANDRATLVK